MPDGVLNIYSARNGARSCDNVCSCNIEGTVGLSKTLRLRQLEDIRPSEMLLSESAAYELRASPSVSLEGFWLESSSFGHWLSGDGDLYFYDRTSSSRFLQIFQLLYPA